MESNVKPLIYRSIVFVSIFVFISALVGSWVIPSRLLYGSNFYIYANMGKALLVFCVVLFMLTRPKLPGVKVEPRDWMDSLLIVAGVLLLPVIHALHMYLLGYQVANQSLIIQLASHALLVLLVTLIFIGCFGFFTTQTMIKTFKREVAVASGVAAVTYLAIFQIWKLWPILSKLILNIVYFLIKPFVAFSAVEPPLRLTANNFSIIVGESCSGLDSLLMFTLLYGFMILNERQYVKKLNAVLLFVLGFIGVFLLNILRVSLIVIVGAFLSEHLAIGMFHSYAGMVLFLLYFAIFVSYFNKYLKIHPINNE